jgi:hypothetical protein
MNMLLTYKVLGLRPEEVQVVLWDKFADGPYHDLIQKAFSPKHPVQRHTHYRGKVSGVVWCSCRQHLYFVWAVCAVVCESARFDQHGYQIDVICGVPASAVRCLR